MKNKTLKLKPLSHALNLTEPLTHSKNKTVALPKRKNSTSHPKMNLTKPILYHKNKTVVSIKPKNATHLPLVDPKNQTELPKSNTSRIVNQTLVRNRTITKNASKPDVTRRPVDHNSTHALIKKKPLSSSKPFKNSTTLPGPESAIEH